MICTITLNPSIDKAYRLASPLATGEVQRVAQCIDNAGGKGLNAARAVKALGAEVVATGFIGGHNGALLEELLDKDGVAHDFVEVAGETRCCINALDPDGGSTELLEPGRAVDAEDFQRLLDKVSELLDSADVVTIDGSVPAGLDGGAYATLITMAKDRERPVLLDTSGALLERGVEALPTMVKPNADELAQLTGRPTDDMDAVAEAALALHQKGIERVVVSLGAEGALMACADGVFRGICPAIEVVNPVGSGDTLVGAFAVGLERGLGDAENLAFAMGAASANCLSAATGSFDPEKARALTAQTKVERID